MLSLLALPLVVTSVREGLQAIPNHVREASYAVGKTKIATIRRVLLPAVRPDIITGSMIGAGHAIGDTAIIVFLLGDTYTLQGVGGVPLLGTLRGHRQHAHQLHLRQRAHRRPQPAQQGVRGRAGPARDGLDYQRRCRHLWSESKGTEMDVITAAAARPPARARRHPHRAAAARRRSRRIRCWRMRSLDTDVREQRDGAARGRADARAHAGGGALDQLRPEARRAFGLAADPAGRGARADRAVGMRQDDAAALAEPTDRADQVARRSAAASRSTASTSPNSSRRRCAGA